MRLERLATLALVGMALVSPALAQDAVTYAADIRLFVDEGAVRIGTDPDLDGLLDDEFLFLTDEDLTGLVTLTGVPYRGWADLVDYTGDTLAVRTEDGTVNLVLAVAGSERPDPSDRSWNVRPIEGFRLTRYYGFSNLEFAGWVPPFLPLRADCGKPGLGDESCDSKGTGGRCSTSGCGTNVIKKAGFTTRSGTTEGKPSGCSTTCDAGEVCCAGCVPNPEYNLFGIETHKTYYAACTCCE
jgi:hypothetical protein